MSNKIIALAGDGIGPEIMASALQILEAITAQFNLDITVIEQDFGGISIDKHDTPLTDETLQLCQESDAILLGAIGGPKWKPHPECSPEAGLLKLRKELNLFTNIRPVFMFDELLHLSPIKEHLIKNVNITIFRELTGGIYFGIKSRSEKHATDLCAYSSDEIERITQAACEFALSNKSTKITLIDKANVLETSRLWRDVVSNFIKSKYPGLSLEYQLVDSAAMKLITQPSVFDVILTENMFGDIISDEASVLSGSIGMLPSASLSYDNFGLYEPIHGSAPDIAGQNIANPYGMILSVAMMFKTTFHRIDIYDVIFDAVKSCLRQGYLTKDLDSVNNVSTSEVTEHLKRQLYEMELL